MTTFIPFVPSPNGAFRFTAILDNTTYTLSVPWNIFGQRWYLQCTGTNGTLIFTLPLIGSPTGSDINIVDSYFEVSSLVFRADTQTFEITP